MLDGLFIYFPDLCASKSCGGHDASHNGGGVDQHNDDLSFDFDRPRTVYQVVMLAGGATDYGSLSNVHLTRIIDGEQRTETINLRPTVHGKPTLPIYVQDGDVIYISRNWF